MPSVARTVTLVFLVATAGLDSSSAAAQELRRTGGAGPQARRPAVHMHHGNDSGPAPTAVPQNELELHARPHNTSAPPPPAPIVNYVRVGSSALSNRQLTGDASYTSTTTFSTYSSVSSCVCQSTYGIGYQYTTGSDSFSYTDQLDSTVTVTRITTSWCGTPCGATSMTMTVGGVSLGSSSTLTYSCSCSDEIFWSHDSGTGGDWSSYTPGATISATMNSNGNIAYSGVVLTIYYTDSGPAPTAVPRPSPTAVPRPSPTKLPLPQPTKQPLPSPTKLPLPSPTKLPVPQPTKLPVPQPTKLPVPQPTKLPLPQPSGVPQPAPTKVPLPQPSKVPVPAPTSLPTPRPSPVPTVAPSPVPSSYPSPECAGETYLYKLVMYDADGDGWGDGEYVISSETDGTSYTGTLDTGYDGVEYFCLGDDTWSITISLDDSSISFEFDDVSGDHFEGMSVDA